MALTSFDAQALLATLRTSAPGFGETLAQTAYSRGLAVTNKDDGTTRPIPITATPVFIDRALLQARQRLAQHLSSATVKMSRHVMTTPTLRPLVVDGLSPLERRLAEATGGALDTLVTTRVDFFAASEQASALEVNATIPAMQAYSDIAANTFLEVVGKHFGAAASEVERWKQLNGSNSRALYDALLAGYAKVRPGRRPNRIALLSRRNDAQLTEQRALCEAFRTFGAEAELVHPDQLSGSDAVHAHGKTWDLVYRHLFVRRLEEQGMVGADYVTSLLAEPNGTRAVVLNPPASQVEVKAVFALLSLAIEDGALGKAAGLNDEELEAIRRAVPWTRHFRGEALLKQVQANPDRYVLKRSWDYGGRAVFVGKTRQEPGFTERARAAWGVPLDWNAVCARAVQDPVGGGFVVQELVEIHPEPHLLCSGKDLVSTSLFVDFSAYASVGLDQPGWGGVCRGSLSHIVNIVGGGGVLPLLTTEVGRELAAFAARSGARLG